MFKRDRADAVYSGVGADTGQRFMSSIPARGAATTSLLSCFTDAGSVRQRRVDQPLEAPDSDAQLVARIRTGDPDAEAELYRRYCESVRVMLRYRTRKAEIAEELCNDTFIILLKKLRRDGLEEPEKLSAFVHRTAHYVYLDWVRPRIGRREIEASDPDLLKRLHGQVDTPHDHEQHTRALRAIVTLLSALAPRDRDVLDRFYLRDQDKARVCKELDLSPANFDRVISRARIRLRELLARLHIDPQDLSGMNDPE